MAVDEPIPELREWELTPEWERRFDEWISPGGHGARGDLRNDPIAWTPLVRPLSECTVALVTTAGVHLRTQPPFDVLRREGDWSYREIPWDTPADDLMITHTHYNHDDADRDVNCMFPVDRLRELRAAGVIGAIAPMFFGLMGFVPNATPTLRETAPVVAERLRAEGAEIVVLSPG